MSAETHGLVIGKFYPPHAGHHHLVERALAGADRVTVLVLAAGGEAIALAARVAWMRERHPAARVIGGVDDHPIDYDDPSVWDAHMAVFRALCPDPVDLVFSSEPYGEELAARLRARHVSVDSGRRAFPVSGTQVRADPVAHWDHLAAPVRAALTRRVAIVGAESTGKTTLARALAEHYRTAWVPEYGRVYTEQLVRAGTPAAQIGWSDADFVTIAQRQQADEDAAARMAGPVLICDTDALATCVWQERYLRRSTAEVEAVAAAREISLYVLTGCDVAFEADGVRDGEHLREWMTQRFRERLRERPEPSIEVHGTLPDRIRRATAAIDAILAGWTLA